MRSRSRDKQKVWFARIEEVVDGIDTVSRYGKPRMKMLSVSTTSGTPEEIAAGIVPDYDRYITRHKIKGCPCHNIEIAEGDVCWVDVVPKCDYDGNLVMQEGGVTPLTPPDYVVKRILQSQKQSVVRYGIAKIGGSE